MSEKGVRSALFGSLSVQKVKMSIPRDQLYHLKTEVQVTASSGKSHHRSLVPKIQICYLKCPGL